MVKTVVFQNYDNPSDVLGAEHWWYTTTNCEVTEPEIKWQTIEVPLMNGVLDFTDANGVKYGNRKVILDWISNNESFEMDDTFYDDIMAQVHGKKFRIWSGNATDPNTKYFVGRASVKSNGFKGNHRLLTITFDCEPYRRTADFTATNRATGSTPSRMLVEASPMPSEVFLRNTGKVKVRFQKIGVRDDWQTAPIVSEWKEFSNGEIFDTGILLACNDITERYVMEMMSLHSDATREIKSTVVVERGWL